MEAQQPGTKIPLKHSKLGIASFTLILMFVAAAVLVSIIIALEINVSPGPASDAQKTFNQFMVGCVALLLPASFIVGVIALFQKNTNKIFATLGVGFSVLVFLLLCLCAAGLVFLYFKFGIA